MYIFTKKEEERMDSELLKGVIDVFILSNLKKEDSYGYKIAKDIKEKSKNAYSISEGTLYLCLKRLEKKLLVESYWYKDDNIKIKRKYYKITDAGIKFLYEKINDLEAIINIIKDLKEE